MTARWTAPLLALVVALAFTASARAADKTIDGTWKSTFKAQDGTERVTTFKLKQEGDKVTGTVSGRNNSESDIQDGKIKDGTITFSVTREFNNNKVTIKYEGKLDGDTIKGTREMPGRDGGDPVKRDFEAKREKEKKE
ncbi:MAG: hypothetical protein JWN24_2290 [Phycisphaerales bacterium]|nr:hypothetical protein [Phycisphaerales bacterium]